MSAPIITLTTDFGGDDSYVAQMKGVILGLHPQASIVDVSHTVPPQDIRRGALLLESLPSAFPPRSIHVVVVDPGVGTDRALVGVEMADQRFLLPDNGLLTFLLQRHTPQRVHRLAEPRFWRTSVSQTFHGRDILAPVAACWSRGHDLAEFGPPLATPLQQFPTTPVQRVFVDDVCQLTGRIDVIDHFGNLITSLRDGDLAGLDKITLAIAVGPLRVTGLSNCYSAVSTGEPVAVVGSSGRLEIARRNGSAAELAGLRNGLEIAVTVAGRREPV
jgi:S-adenosylmethionine hydrolase